MQRNQIFDFNNSISFAELQSESDTYIAESGVFKTW